MNWNDFFEGLFFASLVGVIALIAVLIFGRGETKKLLGAIVVTMCIVAGSAIGAEQTTPPLTVEHLDNTKCSMYVWRGKWDCVPWDQAG